MSVDPRELADFKDWLAHAPVDLIQQRLDEDAIKRAWKRELAEQEILRRQSSSGPARSASIYGDARGMGATRRHRAAVFYSWVVTIILIISLVLVSFSSIMN